ncbi:hypothetical protein G6F37_003915 [Rhizopus arrhizus]|nr:hypothetical protein G6F38_004084 [Rhizopus arrhizus]KAG1160516.1 hypothetical protein G6F37_003915 [Rhizopus arrhizus]
MGTTKSRKSRRNNSRPTAFSFLSNITLGNENEKPPDEPSIRKLSLYSPTSNVHLFNNNNNNSSAASLHSTDSSFSGADESPLPANVQERTNSTTSQPVMTTKQDDDRSSNSSGETQHHKLTREDSERPIASEKIKKKSNKDHPTGNMTFMSVVRYYTEKLRQSTSKKKPEGSTNRGYVQQQLESNDSHKYRKAQSYAHFLAPAGSLLDEANEMDKDGYDPFFLDDDSYGQYGLAPGSLGTMVNGMRPSDMKREMNEQFRLNHPELRAEMTLSKIRAIKLHLLEIGKQLDLEISSVAHAFVYFEKLVIKNVVTKKNRKLIAACCLFLASKVNEAKGTWFQPLLEAMDDELDVDIKEIHEHEFAVFADLEFNLYVAKKEFMPHFERIFNHLEHKSIQEYLGHSTFYNGF